MVADHDYSIQILERPSSLEQPYHEARAHIVMIGAKWSPLKVRLVAYYGKSGCYQENAEELAAVLDQLAEQPDIPTAVAGGF